VTLSWNKTADLETSQNGLTYNVRVGTAPGKDDVMSGMAHTTSGLRRIPALGNVNMNHSWKLTLPQGGTNYWSVQAVDTALTGGAWATEESFHIRALPSVTTDPITDITPSDAHGGGNVASEGDSPVTAKGLVWSPNANPTLTNYLGKTDHGAGTGSFTDTMTSLTSGQTYYVRAYATSSLGTNYGAQRLFSPSMTPPGNALQLDGVNDYVSIADADDLDMTSNYTLEAWFKADSFGASGGLRGLVSKYQTGGANGYFLRLTGTNLDFDGMTTSGMNLQAGAWHHVAAVNSNGTRRLYLNGVAQTLVGSPLTVQANGDKLTLGSDFLVNNNRYFAGQMDEARIWNVARGQAEIQSAMHRELNGSETGLVAYYNFNHVSGTTLYDVTGKGHDGTLVNGPVWLTSTIPMGWTLTATTGAHGTMTPTGSVAVPAGGSTNFVITPGAYYNVANVTTNGISVGAVTSFTWNNVAADGTINATFAAQLAAKGTPHWWLAQYGWTNEFDAAEVNDADGDGALTWQEYQADTNPRDSNSVLRLDVANQPPTASLTARKGARSGLPPLLLPVPMIILSWESSSNRLYTLEYNTNLNTTVWTVLGQAQVLGSGGWQSVTPTNLLMNSNWLSPYFFRLKATLPPQ
jgi:hypothetical protein